MYRRLCLNYHVRWFNNSFYTDLHNEVFFVSSVVIATSYPLLWVVHCQRGRTITEHIVSIDHNVIDMVDCLVGGLTDGDSWNRTCRRSIWNKSSAHCGEK